MIGFIKTFDTFIEDKSNSIALQVCREVTQYIAERYNPLWIHGPSGCGKSHLLLAIQHELRRRKDITVIYLDAETVVEDLVAGILGKDGTGLIKEADVLLVDNADYFMGKEATQEAISRFIAERCAAGRQTVLASARPPSRFTELRRRLKSGLLIEVQHPGKELKRTYLERITAQNGFPMTREAEELLVSEVNNVGTIAGAVYAAGMHAHVYKTRADVNWAVKFIDKIRRAD